MILSGGAYFTCRKNWDEKAFGKGKEGQKAVQLLGRFIAVFNAFALFSCLPQAHNLALIPCTSGLYAGAFIFHKLIDNN